MTIAWGIRFRSRRRDQWISGRHGPIKFATKEDAEGMIAILYDVDQNHPHFTAVEMSEAELIDQNGARR
jgi:hypothetical protein